MSESYFDHLSPRALRGLAESFVGQESTGVFGNLLLRLARYLQGDPALALNVAVSNAAAVGLPDLPAAFSAVLTVTGAPLQYRIDGSAPVASDPVLQPGSVLTLLGRPTIIAFRAIATTATSATLAGNYYD